MVRISDKELLVDLTRKPGALSPWNANSDAGSLGSGLRASSVELERIAVSNTAPNLAQVVPSVSLKSSSCKTAAGALACVTC